MFAAFLSTFFFSLSSIAANRAISFVGTLRANLGRLLAATTCLAVWAEFLPWLGVFSIGLHGFEGAGLPYFLASGALGMGLGDIGQFAALPLLGARLTVVMTQCLAAPIAGLVEWAWLGTHLSFPQIGCSAVVLGGVALALAPSRAHPPRVRVRPIGALFGLFSALGQGGGAVLSRKAYDATAAAGQQIDGLTATFQRIVAGFAITIVFVALYRGRQRENTSGPNAGLALAPTPNATSFRPSLSWMQRWRWTLLNGLSGPFIGVSCYQWALSTTPSGIVLPIVATTPIIVIPLAYWIEGERPTRRSLIGGLIAVAGAVALKIVK
jgi:drug/metabolite transporter (DMT)-like permease